MSLLEVFKSVTDFRRKQGKQYKLEYILLFSVLAVLSGATSYVSISRWMQAKKETLNQLFGLNWRQAPSKTRLHIIFSNLDTDSLEQAFRKFSRQLLEIKFPLDSGKYLSLATDGKNLKQSYDTASGESALNLVSLFATEEKLILAHIDIPNKESEMKAVQELIKSLEIPSLISMDALHTQKNS